MSTAMTAENIENPEAEAAPQAASAVRTRPRMRGRSKLLLIVLSLVMMGVFRTGFVFIIIGMMPTIVTHYLDISRKRYMFRTIFAFNLSGMMPFLAELLQNGPNSVTMQNVMGDAGNWFLIYGSALIGWMIVRVAPMVAHTFINGFHSTQIMRLRSNQQRIEKEWGPEVTRLSRKSRETAEEDDLFS